MYNRPPVYERVATNRRKTRLLFALAATLGLPYAICVGVLFFLPLVLIAAAFILSEPSGVHPVVSDGALAFGVVAGLAGALLVSVAITATAVRRFGVWVVLRLVHARRIDSTAFPDLAAAAKEMSGAARLPMPALAVIDSAEPNAFAVGWAPTSATVVVTRGLLALLKPRELRAVVVHELAHIGNEDTRPGTTLACMVLAFAWPALLPFALLRSQSLIRRYAARVALIAAGLFVLTLLCFSALAVVAAARDPDVRMFWSRAPVLWRAILLAPSVSPFYIFLVAPLIALATRSAVWDQREVLADAEGSIIGLDPAALAHALVKIGAAGGSQALSTSGAHLFIADPPSAQPAFWRRWFPTHPAIDARVESLKRRFRAIDGLETAAQEGARYHDAVADAGGYAKVSAATAAPAETRPVEAAGSAAGTAALPGADVLGWGQQPGAVIDRPPGERTTRATRRKLSVLDLNGGALYRLVVFGIIGLVFLQPGCGMVFGIPILIYACWPLLALLGEERVIGPCPRCGATIDTGLPGVTGHITCGQCRERVEIRGDVLVAREGDDDAGARAAAPYDEREGEGSDDGPAQRVPFDMPRGRSAFAHGRHTDAATATIPVYEQPDGWSAVIAMVRPDDVIPDADAENYGNFVKARLADGRVGYVAKSAVGDTSA